jgi:hypothetical protein
MTEVMVRGLPLPSLLTDMLTDGRWRHPGDAALRDLVPWFESPLAFLASANQMDQESAALDMFADDELSSQLFRTMRGSVHSEAVELPWLDTERAVLIAVNSIPGDDVAVALDYRQDHGNPRVVASDFWTDPKQCSWRIVAASFAAFATGLGLT